MPTMSIVAKFVIKFSMLWRPSAKVLRWLVAPPISGASPCSRSLSAMWLGRLVSGWPRPSASMDLPIPLDFCSSTLKVEIDI
jgi:hypothetical protein